MTTVLVVETDDVILLGADRQYSWGSMSREGTKIVQKAPNFIFAGAGQGSTIKCFENFNLPSKKESESDSQYLFKVFDAFKDYCKELNNIIVDKNVVYNQSSGIVVYNYKKYLLSSDFIVYEIMEDRTCLGSGGDFALGYLEDREVTKDNIIKAIQCSIKYDRGSGLGVDGIEQLKPKNNNIIKKRK